MSAHTAFRITVREDSNKELLKMLAESSARLKGHNKYVEPVVVQKD